METTRRGDVLVVDDDQDIREALEILLTSSGLDVATAASGEEALDLLGSRAFDAALVDLQLPLLRGTDVVERAHALQPDLEAVIITANGTFASAVEALRAGAYDFIEKPFSNDHLVRVIGHAVERRRLRLAAEEHRARVEALSTLHAVAHASGSSLVVSEILDAALTITRERLHADAAVVGLLDPAPDPALDPPRRRYTFARQSGLSDGAVAALQEVSADDPLAQQLAASVAPVTLADLGTHTGVLAARTRAHGFASACLVPVVSAGRPIGALVALTRRRRTFSESEVLLLQAIGEELGPPIQNARIHEQATMRAAQLRAVDEVVRAINSEHDLTTVLEAVTRRAVGLVDAESALVMLPTDDGAHLRMVAAHGPRASELADSLVPLEGSVNGEVFRTGRAFASSLGPDDARVAGVFRPMTTGRSEVLVVPLPHRGQALGTLTVASRARADRPFTADEAAMLALLAEHAAIAIDNARLHTLERAQTAALEARVEERTRALREAQEQLVRRERLAILGRLAGSVSHEIRNPLGVLRNSLYFLRMVLEGAPDEEVLRHIEIMEQEVDRANRIVGDLLDYARVRAPVVRPVVLSTTLARALAQTVKPPGIAVVRDFDPDAPAALGDADQLLLVFGNLVRNAIQAMAHGGTLTLRVVPDGDSVVGEVRDTGTGISVEVRDRLFEPLVTTKTKGLGLGLATARNLVEMNKGTITVESTPGQGATFRVRLLAAARPERLSGPSRPPPPP